ncbi:PD40 domain-containing protein [Sphingopyxis sp. JAI128]|uniref:PD40 domain-containing protein n=1 Tax=Sphingopyxis sp. JAI128 TaxID=2723066 RepID=UPI00161B94BD|nr:PD40 domain-containing protein [Sphingopyxis sp. JAI128]MBB6428002.1 Tol biopolymer transport system component [Sphingopyxis sp. JAI128]
MAFANRAPALACAAALAACGIAAETPEPATATLWTPAAISGPGYESSPTFTPDGRTMIYLAADKDFGTFRLMQSQCEKGAWSKPVPPPFAKPFPVIEADPFITSNGKRLYYISSRHAPDKEDFDIWYVERIDGGAWSEPQRLPEPVNSPAAELLPRTDADGRLYFGSSRAGSAGGGDIYAATEVRPGEWQVENLGPPVSGGGYEYEAEISRDGRTLIAVSDRGDRSHLYRYRRKDGRWVEVGRIPADPAQFQVGPLLSPKGDRLLFAQRHGDRSGEMFLVDLMPEPDQSWPPDCGGQAGS